MAECTFAKAIVGLLCMLYIEKENGIQDLRWWRQIDEIEEMDEIPFSEATDRMYDADFKMKGKIIVMKEDSSLETESKEVPLPEWILQLTTKVSYKCSFSA